MQSSWFVICPTNRSTRFPRWLQRWTTLMSTLSFYEKYQNRPYSVLNQSRCGYDIRNLVPNIKYIEDSFYVQHTPYFAWLPLTSHTKNHTQRKRISSRRNVINAECETRNRKATTDFNEKLKSDLII